jgi:hypothetical protein
MEFVADGDDQCGFMINLLINSSLWANHDLHMLKTRRIMTNNDTVHTGIKDIIKVQPITTLLENLSKNTSMTSIVALAIA